MQWARVEVVPDGPAVRETPAVVRVGEFHVEVSGDFSRETLAAVLDVLEGMQRCFREASSGPDTISWTRLVSTTMTADTL